MSDDNPPAKPTPDQSAAHHFLAELRTRISIQPLPYQAGIEASALESLWQLFAHARSAIQKYPGCSRFAHDVADMLNVHVRPSPRSGIERFGIRIDSTLEDLRPNPASKFSKTHYMFCRVRYPAEDGKPGPVGLLLYIKLSVTRNEAELIKRYRLLHPDFPHQSTLDQFFDEEQFEAYRQLGAHVMESLFSKPLVGDIEPSTVRDWFRGLAGSLLEPVQSARPTSKQTESGPATASP